MGFFGGVIVLLGLWLLLSGIYTPMIVGFGAASAVLAVYVVRRMDAEDGAPVLQTLGPFRFLGYLLWLMGEIAKANWAVTKIVMSPEMPIRQHLFAIPFSQKSDLARVIFANSITLTPGTITVETEEDRFLVHAVAFSEGDHAALADMDARVTATEPRQTEPGKTGGAG